MRCRAAAASLATLAAAACRAPDPKAALEVRDVEAYFVLDAPRDDNQYLAPAVRFRVRNKGATPAGAIQANAVFRRVGEENQTWGADWLQVAPSRKPLAPGQATLVVMKSDGRYYSTGIPQTMFSHQLFRDVNVDIFLRMGASAWTKMAQARVERRIGARGAGESAP